MSMIAPFIRRIISILPSVSGRFRRGRKMASSEPGRRADIAVVTRSIKARPASLWMGRCEAAQDTRPSDREWRPAQAVL